MLVPRTKLTSDVHVVIPIAPVVASRPRVTRWGTYYAKTYREWRKRMGETLAAVTCPYAVPLTGPFDITIFLRCHKPKTTKRDYPRGDTDNYIKAVLDSMQSDGRWFEDDDQVVHVEGYKYFVRGCEQPSISVYIRPATLYPEPQQ